MASDARREARDAPDVIALPPLIGLAALVLASLLEWALPLDLLPPPLAPIAAVAGTLLVAGGLAVTFWGAHAFKKASTNINPRQPALVLVESGPYRFTRNPMYLGFLLVLPGIGLIASLDWSLPMTVVLWLVLHHGVVLREEAYLSAKFGDAYHDFRARTRRWL